MSDAATLTIRFSRAASPNLREMWQQKSPINYSKWICRLTHSPFSHVDMLVEEQGQPALLGSSNSPYAPVIVGNPCGVAIRPIEYQRFALRRDAVMPTTVEIKNKFEQFCRSQIGKPFDTEALKPSIFLSPDLAERDWHDNDKWWCAELIGSATDASNFLGYAIPGIKNRITAADLILLFAPKVNYDVAFQPIAGLQLQPGEV